VNVWLIAFESIRRSFTSRLLVLVGLVVVLFLAVTSCFFGGTFYTQGQVYDPSQQLGLARTVSYYFASGWGVLFAIMLGMGAVSQPLSDGRAAFLLAKPQPRTNILLGQLLGAFLTAAATVAALGLLASALYLIRGHSFPGTLWLGFAVTLLALALATLLVAFFSLFLPRVVAGMLGIIVYLASLPAASGELRDFMTGGYKEAGFAFPWWVKWGSEVYFAAAPPLAGIQLRGAALLAAGAPWGFDQWLTLAAGAAYVAALFVGTWALYARRDI